MKFLLIINIILLTMSCGNKYFIEDNKSFKEDMQCPVCEVCVNDNNTIKDVLMNKILDKIIKDVKKLMSKEEDDRIWLLYEDIILTIKEIKTLKGGIDE